MTRLCNALATNTKRSGSVQKSASADLGGRMANSHKPCQVLELGRMANRRLAVAVSSFLPEGYVNSPDTRLEGVQNETARLAEFTVQTLDTQQLIRDTV